MSKEYILGIKIDLGLSYSDTIEKISEHLTSVKKQNYTQNSAAKSPTNKTKIICTTNPEFIMKAQKDTKFRDIINDSYLSLPDGFGIVLACEYLKYIAETSSDSLFGRILNNTFAAIKVLFRLFFNPQSFDQTVTGVDLIPVICAFAEKNNYSVGFLGGWPKDFLGRSKKGVYNIAFDASEELKKSYPRLNVAFATSEFSSKIEDDEKTYSFIHDNCTRKNLSSVDIIFVAYAFGAQEKWLLRNMSKINSYIGIGVGGSFDYISGYVVRPSPIIKKFHMEWLYRMITQPYRFKRTLNAFASFPISLYVKTTFIH